MHTLVREQWYDHNLSNVGPIEVIISGEVEVSAALSDSNFSLSGSANGGRILTTHYMGEDGGPRKGTIFSRNKKV